MAVQEPTDCKSYILIDVSVSVWRPNHLCHVNNLVNVSRDIFEVKDKRNPKMFHVFVRGGSICGVFVCSG